MPKLSSTHQWSTSRAVIMILLLGAVSFAASAALAQDHGGHGDTHGTTTTEHEQPAAHGEAAAHGDEHAAAGEHGGAHGEAGEHHSSTPHMKNLVTLIGPFLPPAVAAQMEAFVDPIFAFIVIALICLFFINVSRNLSATNPSRAQMAAELLINGLYGMFQSIIGPSAKRFTPFLGGLFIFIWFNNLFGMVPGAHAATSAFNTTTFGLGLMTFFFVQFWAIRLNGIGGYLHHMAGSPKTGLDWGFSLLLFPLHVLGELIKPVSLGLRLFGNIFGEDTLVATMVILGYIITKLIFGDAGFVAYLPGVPLQLPFYFLGLLSCTIQALVFTLLATVYIALWLPHGDHADHEEAHGH
jgi:F-type H+-transporting ATPase subunit a